VAIVSIILSLLVHLLLVIFLYPLTRLLHKGIKYRLVLPIGVALLYYFALYTSILTDLGLIVEQVFIIVLVKSIIMLFLIVQSVYLIRKEQKTQEVMAE
jgi:hypothetical protein